MTLRHKRIDYFAFTLYHELGHIYLHLQGDRSKEVVDLYRHDSEHKVSAEEIEANEFAQNHLIPTEEWDKLLAAIPISQEYLIEMAERINIHPSVILGRVCYEYNSYAVVTQIDKKIG